jgi:GDPmannose 4,6-dehydratase
MKNALIFGANGQDGYYLCEACRQRAIEPIGVSRNGEWVKGDISQFAQVEHLVKSYHPDFLFHIAANSSTRHETLFENHSAISTGTLNVLEAVKRHSPGTKVFIAGSGLQFRNEGNPIAETDQFEASSGYSAARIHAVYLARYFRSLGVRTYVGYLFHHESPRRTPNHVSKKIALAVQRIAAGSDEMVELGDTSVRKEWTFAGDVAEAILTLVQQDKVFEAAIGSGKAYSIEQWLQYCFDVIGKDWRNRIRLIEGFKPEYSLLVSNPRTIQSLGWREQKTIADLARMMVKQESQENT